MKLVLFVLATVLLVVNGQEANGIDSDAKQLEKHSTSSPLDQVLVDYLNYFQKKLETNALSEEDKKALELLLSLLLFHNYSRQETNILSPEGLSMSNSVVY